MDLRRLNTLRELRDRGTLSAVARGLNFSPSAVSQQLTQLQTELGVQLVERRGRTLELTPAGQALAGDSEAIFEALERARARLANFRTGVGGTIRVAAFQTAASVVMPRALSALASDSLRIEVYELEPEVSLPLLARGELDLVVGQEYDQAPRAVHPGISRRDDAHELILVALPPDDSFAQSASPIPLSALADRRWVAGDPQTAYAQMVVAACRNAGFEPDVCYRSNDVSVLLSLVSHGHAVALVPFLALAAPSLPRVSLHAALGLELRRRIFTAVRRGGDAREALLKVREAVCASLAAQLRSASARTPANDDP